MFVMQQEKNGVDIGDIDAFIVQVDDEDEANFTALESGLCCMPRVILREA